MSTLSLFKKAFIGNTVDYAELAKLAFKLGYLVHPDCSTTEVESYLIKQKIDHNSTFYKSWCSITSKNRFELFLDQIRHYASTYGTGFDGEVWKPDNQTSYKIDYKNFQLILPITKEEAILRCKGMLTSGIALKQDTIEDIIVVLNTCQYQINIEEIKNKESKMWIHKSTNTLPSDSVEMVRYLVFMSTGKSLLIKDKETIQAIKESKLKIVKLVEDFGLTNLASVFYRFRLIFLAFKSNPANKSTINKLRKLAIKNHKPLIKGYWENILSNPESINLLPSKVNELNNFKKITLLEAINVRLAQSSINTYPIRNGRIWLDEERRVKPDDNYLKLVYEIIYNSLVESIKVKVATIKLPEKIDIKLPKSEKSFIGNYPLGTVIELEGQDLIVGINWKNQDGAYDLDLSLIDISGTKFGWNANYTNASNSIIYSGDMTSAEPEATELFYANNSQFNPSVVKVNMYRGEDKSKFKMFIAKEKIDNLIENYMVNPNSIINTTESEMTSREQILGIILPDKFIFANFKTGEKIVSGDSITNKYIQYTLDILNTYLSLAKLLKDAGFTIVNGNQEADIDWTNITKDSLIALLS
jgi:hypothetical protein